jgi:hypothetical protein
MPSLGCCSSLAACRLLPSVTSRSADARIASLTRRPRDSAWSSLVCCLRSHIIPPAGLAQTNALSHVTHAVQPGRLLSSAAFAPPQPTAALGPVPHVAQPGCLAYARLAVWCFRSPSRVTSICIVEFSEVFPTVDPSSHTHTTPSCGTTSHPT